MRPYPFSIFETLAAAYDGPLPRLTFKQGHESEINKLNSSDSFPILFVCEEPFMAVRNIRVGLDEVRFKLYLLRQTPARGNTSPASNVQNDAERYTEFHDDMQRVSEQLCRALQYDTPDVDFASIRWESRPVKALAGSFLTGVEVNGLFVIRNQLCATDFNPFDAQRVKSVTFSPSEGIYDGFVQVEMETATEGATIYYTLDGLNPTPSTGLLYDPLNPPILTSTTLVRARAYKVGLLASLISEREYSVVGLSVTLVPSGGTFDIDDSPFIVPETNNIDAVVRFTLDGSDPTETSPIFSAPIQPTENTEVAVVAFLPPAAPSPIVRETYLLKLNTPIVDTTSGTYTSERLVNAEPALVGVNEYRVDSGAWVVGDSVLVQVSSVVTFRAVSPDHVTSDEVSVGVTIKCAAPTISPDGGTFDGLVEVTIITNEVGGTTRYTTDGSEPTESSTLYTAPFTLLKSDTVKAKTFRSGTTASETTSKAFVIVERVLYVGGSANTGRLYRSVNNGVSWTELQPFGNVGRGYLDSQVSNDGASILIYAVDIDLNNLIRISKDAAQSWQIPSFPSTPIGTSNVFKGSSDGGKYIGAVNIGNGRTQILVSTDGGLTFVDRSPSLANFNNCVISPNGNVMYACKSSISNVDNDVIYRSYDDGITWTAIVNTSNRVVPVEQISASNDAVYYHLQNQNSTTIGIFRTTHDSVVQNNLSTAIGSFSPAPSALTRIQVSDDDSLIVVYNTFVNLTRRSTNQGASFSSVNLLANSPVKLNINANGTKVIAGDANNIISLSLNGGASYALPATTPGFGGNNWRLADLN